MLTSRSYRNVKTYISIFHALSFLYASIPTQVLFKILEIVEAIRILPILLVVYRHFRAQSKVCLHDSSIRLSAETLLPATITLAYMPFAIHFRTAAFHTGARSFVFVSSLE